MKKLILVLAILLVASPVWAALDVNLVLVDSDTVAVVYTGADSANLPRAFALTLTITGGTFDSFVAGSYLQGESTAAAPGFGIYPARIAIDSTGTVTGYGDPLADSADPGATAGFGTSSIVLEFGSLYYGDANAPLTGDTLCEINFTKGTAAQITLADETTYRGGIVLENGTQLTDTAAVTLAVPECLSSSATEYSKWVEYGKPDCWCFRKQCRGDADGVKTTLKPVMNPDLTIFKAAFNQSKTYVKTLIVSGKPGICADFDHKDTTLKPVMNPDLTIFKEYFNDSDASVPQCDAAPVVTGPYNSWKN